MMRCFEVLVSALALILGCTSGGESLAGVKGGSETTNGIIASVVYPDGAPAAKATVRLRPSRFLAGASDSIYARDTLTDASGTFRFAKVPRGEYTIEILGSSEDGAVLQNIFIKGDGGDYELGNTMLEKIGSIRGIVNRTNIDSTAEVFVKVYGLQRLARARKTGEFTLDSLPPAGYTMHIVTSTEKAGVTEKIVTAQEGQETFLADTINLPIDYYRDSLAVRAFLDEQGITDVPWEDLVSVEGNRIRRLYLGNMGLQTLSPKIGTLTFLWKLTLADNPLQNLPPEISELDLNTLSLSGVPMDSIVEGFSYVQSLTSLNLDRTGIKALPDDLHRLNLRHLTLEDNALQTFPEPVLACSTLITLVLENNSFTRLPVSFGAMVNLERLYLVNNKIDSIGDVIGELPHLRILDLNNNGVSWVSDSIGTCTWLESLFLQNGTMPRLPETIGNLTSLQRLNVHNQNLEALPLSITGLTNITHLFLDQNRLCNVAPEIENWIVGIKGSTEWEQSQEGCL